MDLIPSLQGYDLFTVKSYKFTKKCYIIWIKKHIDVSEPQGHWNP